MKSEKLYLVNILESYERIQRHTGNDVFIFRESELVQDAVVKVLSNLTESASKLEDTTKDSYPEIPWKLIAAFRNVLVHDYLGDLEIEDVWKIISDDLPELIFAVRKILKDKYAIDYTDIGSNNA
ncbi:MAG: HepT-like ribonuclease domain-containing protein [Pseudomonadota bacterium]